MGSSPNKSLTLAIVLSVSARTLLSSWAMENTELYGITHLIYLLKITLREHFCHF